jgi:intracellular multiplication protein IcmC
MQNRKWLLICAFAVVFLATGSNDAQAGSKLSDVIKNFQMSFGSFQNILSTVAWLSGAFLGAAAVFKFKDHVDNPMQTPLSMGVKRMIAGGAMLSLPFSMNVVVDSLHGQQGQTATTNTGFGTLVAPPVGGLDKMVVDVMKDIAGPIENLLVAFSYLAGISLLLVGISRLTKRMEEGPKGPAGFGTIMTFIAAGMLLNYGSSIGVFTGSIFGNNQLLTNMAIDPNVISNAADRDRVTTVLGGLEVFVMIVGYIAFLRGWIVLKNFADGQQGATLAQGLTFLVGGAVAINLGELVNAVTNTVGVAGLSFG